MNPAFQQAMMAGQNMPQGGGNFPNQLKATLLNRFQQQPRTGWQTLLPPLERVNSVVQIATSLELAAPNHPAEGRLRTALAYEMERFNLSQSRDQYGGDIRRYLGSLQAKRVQQAQANGLVHAGNQGQGMVGMGMGQPMQASMSAQGNAIAQQFPPQLQRPMQASPLPMNQQNPQAMQMGAGVGMPNQGANQQPRLVQQQAQAQAQNVEALNDADRAMIANMANQIMQKTKPDMKQQILQRFQAMPPARQQVIRNTFGDPIAAHCRQVAQQAYMRFKSNMANQAQNQMPNGMMGQQTPMQPRPQQQMQNGNAQADGNVDFSQLMSHMAGQQQEAMRSQDSGQLVVPASNNAMMGPGMNGLPMGLQNGQAGPPGMAQIQNGAQQRPGVPQNVQQQAAMRLAQNQVQFRAQAGQNGQQNQLNPQMRMGNQMSPAQQIAQPGMPGAQQQQPGAAPQQQQQRPTPTPGMPQQGSQFTPQMMQALQQNSTGANGMVGPIRRPLPNDLPPNLSPQVKAFLQTAPDDKVAAAIRHLKLQAMGGDMQNAMGGIPQPAQGPGMGQMPNQMAGGGSQNQPPMAQLQAYQRSQMLQRMRQNANGAQQMNRNGPAGPIPVPSPEVLQEMDKRPFPRVLLSANNVHGVPDHIITFLQLKNWVMANPGPAGVLTVQKLTSWQMSIYARERQAQANQNGNNVALAGQNNMMGGGAGPAPTAPMVAPGALNIPQQIPQRMNMPMNMSDAVIAQQLQQITSSPEEVRTVRQRGMFPAHLTDEEIRARIVDMKRQKFLKSLQHMPQNGMAQMQAMQQPGGNQMVNQAALQNQMPQPTQRPQANQQMAAAQKANMAKQAPQPAQAPQPGLKTPQQAAKKRPAPEESIDLTDSKAPQAPPMQATKSQQPQSTTQPQAGQQPGSQQTAVQKFMTIFQQANARHQKRPPAQLPDQERRLMQQKAAEFAQFSTKLEICIKNYFALTSDEEETRNYFVHYLNLRDNINMKDGSLLPNPTLRLNELEALFDPIKQLTVFLVQKKKEQRENSAQRPQQPSQGNVQSSPPAPQQLNAANLDQHEKSMQAQVQHKRAASKTQAPPAPTAGPGQMPFSFNTSSPTRALRVPQYGEGAQKFNAGNMQIPRKKQKKDGQPASATSTPAQASPVIGKLQSPEMRKQAPPSSVPQAPPPPKFPCRDGSCEFSRKGFKTAEELQKHMTEAHSPPADPAKYLLDIMEVALGLDKDGNPSAAAKAVQTTKSPQKANGPAPADIAKTKEPPALDRLKPPHARKPSGPVSDSKERPADSTASAAKPTEQPTSQEMALDLSSDSWASSTIQQDELMDWFKPFDSFTGDWGNDRALRSPQLTPATTPDTSVTGKTASTRDSNSADVNDSDALKIQITLPIDPEFSHFKISSSPNDLFGPGFFDFEADVEGDLAAQPALMQDLAEFGVEEDKILRLHDRAQLDDWDAVFGPDGGEKVPGWEGADDFAS